MDLFAVPELAVQTFERLHCVRVTVHDLAGNLWPYLSPERFQHVHPLCQAVKVFYPERCIEFGITQMRRQLPNQRDGRVQVCFAGLVEWVVPVFRRGGLMWVVFAGPRLAADNLHQAVRDPQAPPGRRVWPKGTPMPAKVGDDEAQAVLEALRQLAARLECWHAERERSGVQAPDSVRKDGFVDDFATRRAGIHRFVQMRHTAPVRLADLAEVLNLSESRTAHAVKEVCGHTFVQLLTEARLRTASSLLRHTNIDILEVALRSGFGEVSHFHRCFRSRFKTTPLKYRKQAEAPAS